MSLSAEILDALGECKGWHRKMYQTWAAKAAVMEAEAKFMKAVIDEIRMALAGEGMEHG